jgi:hypothetical protein
MLLGCMALLLALKWQFTLMGQQMFLPSQLFLFAAIGDSICICFLLWRIMRIKKGNDHRAAAKETSYIGDLAKILGVYAALNAIAFGIVFIAAKISFGRVAWDYFLFLMPGLLGIPAISRARQLIHRPKASALWFALAMGLFGPAVVFAMVYSGLDRWLGFPMGGRGIIFPVVFGTVIAASTAYYSTYKSLSQRELVNQADQLRGQPPDSA